MHTVQRWLARAKGSDLETVDWSNRSHTPHTIANKTSPEVEREICLIRKQLESKGALGFCGAQSIAEALQSSSRLDDVPSVRTIGRVLRRNGFLDRPRRIRNVAPPAGWYLPGLTTKLVDVDSFDVIEDLRAAGNK